MDTVKKKERQTHIIDDLDAIELVQQGQRKGVPKQKKTGGPNLPGPHSASGAKPKPAKRAPSIKEAGPRFYEKGGLKIPLYDKSGKKRPHARLSQGLRNKNLDQLLDIVEEYAGANKKNEFKYADKTKTAIADWIEAAETRALLPNPKSKLIGEAKCAT